MRTPFLLVLFLLSASFVKVQANNRVHAKSTVEPDTVKDLRIEKSQIFYQKNVLGKIKTIPSSHGAKSDSYKVEIFSKRGKLVAEYQVEVLNKVKKSQDMILSAQVKTLRDNVVHNGTNFIDFHQKQSDKENNEILQLEKVVQYLFDYRYL